MLILTIASLAACNEVVTVGDGYGRIGLNLGWDTSLATKADGDAVEVGDDTQVTVSVCDMDGNPVAGPTTYVYSALKEAEFEVPVGRYTVKASTGSNHQAAWDSPFYYGEDEVTVYAGRDNQAEVICTLANVKVTVSFDGNNLYENVYIYIHSIQIKDIPKSCWLGKDNKPTSSEQLISNGETISYRTALDDLSGMMITRGVPTGGQDVSDSEGGVHHERSNSLFFL